MAPPGSPHLLRNREYNLWRGFAVEPHNGKWSMIGDHMLEIICAADRKLYDWLFNWCASLVQEPGLHGFVAPLLKGGQRTGKGTFVQILGSFFRPRQFAHLTRPEHLVGDFNSQLSEKTLVFADEAFWGDAKAANALKGLITESTIWINEKHMPVRKEHSCLHIIIASNAQRPVAMESDDGRYAVFQVAEYMKSDIRYFSDLHQAIDSGEREGFLHALLRHPVDRTATKIPPATSAKEEMKAASISPELEWWCEVLSADDKWQSKQPRETLHNAFTGWFEKRRYNGAVPSPQKLGIFFSSHFDHGGMSGWPRYTKVKNHNAWEFPDLQGCRSAFIRAAGYTPAGWK
jgi:hypothetical protein